MPSFITFSYPVVVLLLTYTTHLAAVYFLLMFHLVIDRVHKLLFKLARANTLRNTAKSLSVSLVLRKKNKEFSDYTEYGEK